MIQEPVNWKALERYAASYMRDAILEGKKYNPADGSAAHAVTRMSETFPKEEFPSFHALFAVWKEIK